MTRPQIIRADTIDLQDKSSPTAQDHTNQPQHPAPLGVGPAAPHQEATLRQVENERNSEEARLQSNGAPVDDDSTLVASADGHNGHDDMQQDEQAVRLNGGMTGDGEDSDMHDADEDDLDDDMMDKISSSPSIDDGGYPRPLLPTAWPRRTSSLSPFSSPAFSAHSSTLDYSSPFTTTPIHFPISVAAARYCGDPATRTDDVASAARQSPIPFLSQSRISLAPENQSTSHHRGEYTRSPDLGHSAAEQSGIEPLELSPTTNRLRRIESRIQSVRDDSQLSLGSEMDENDVKLMLQPLPSPKGKILEGHVPEVSSDLGTETETDDDDSDDDSWTTDSDADSWDEETHDDDDCNDSFFSDDSRFIDSGWGGECLREVEDIDFEFVYALHTFVATVEGQANATKGDTMVLLDDSNSYWWLVRVVKDSSIGYLPAEHIETPTERLARLNKHRNIDLSATMLGDTAEKTKNPLKKAIRRRNAKTVQFAPPTYVEASDYDYSSDEGGDEELFGGPNPDQAQAQAASEPASTEQDDGLKVQPLKLGAKKDGRDPAGSDPDSKEEQIADGDDTARTSDEIFDRPLDPKVSRNGTLRNTDSFFKDDNAETRKITLTPNLLRDDSSTSTTGSRERGPSLESLEKNGFADKVKDDKKKKEKKPGMLSGLFKRKDKEKKGKVGLDSVDSDAEKQSEEFGRTSPQTKDSVAERPSTDQSAPSPQRNPSKGKLQKQQRSRDDSPSTPSKGILKTDSPETSSEQPVVSKDNSAAASAPPQTSSNSTMRLVSPEREESVARSAVDERVQSPDGRSRSSSAASKLNPMNMLKSQQSSDEPRPEKVKKAKQRVQLDDFDTEDDEDNDPFADPDMEPNTSAPAPVHTEADPAGRLSESPVQVSLDDAQSSGKQQSAQRLEQDQDAHQPPGLAADSSSQDTPSPVVTPPLEHSPTREIPSKTGPRATDTNEDHTSDPTTGPTSRHPPSRPAPIPTDKSEPSPPTSSESASLPAWSDSSLRTYLDDGSDIRDMLVVINDTTGVVPVGRDHPLMSQLFVEETKMVTQLGGELDSLLSNWLDAKRKKQRGTFTKA